MNDIVNYEALVRHFILSQNGFFPNSKLPVIIYFEGLNLPDDHAEAEAKCKTLFKKNNWGNNWVDSIYDFHHYHNNTHEVLGVCNGKVKVQLGGPGKNEFELSKGDVIFIPAGVAHKRIHAVKDFSCVGGYPAGRDYDMNYGRAGEMEKSKENINKTPLPDNDAIYGPGGKLFLFWK